MNKQLLAALLAVALVGMTACDAASPAPSASEPASSAASEPSTPSEPDKPTEPIVAGVNAENYPKVDGSTANMPLMAQLYSEVCGVPFEEAETMVEVTTTGPAWRALAYESAELLIVYEAAQEVQEELAESGVALEAAPIGRDGLVFLANKKNPIDSLTQAQLREIYTGQVVDWSGVGGDPGEIAAFQRDPQSGSQTLFLKLLMGDTPPMTPPTELVPAFMGALIDGVSEYDGSGGAIGYSVYYYAEQMYQNDNLKLLAVDGVAPTSETIGDGSYPLVNDFFVVIRADSPADSPARLLYNYLQTDEGKQTLIRAGYVPTGA